MRSTPATPLLASLVLLTACFPSGCGGTGPTGAEAACGKADRIVGIYFSDSDKTDKVYLRSLGDCRYRIHSPGAWDTTAEFDGQVLRGEWRHAEDHPSSPGRSGTHVATFDESRGRFHVVWQDDQGGSEQVTWYLLPRPGDLSVRGPRTIYLTFDDGPYLGTANSLLALEETGVPATFFLVGDHARLDQYAPLMDSLRSNPDLLLANHSYMHDYETDPDFVSRDMARNIDSLFASAPGTAVASKVDGMIARLPGRNLWRLGGVEVAGGGDADPAANRLVREGYAIYGWDIEWKRDGAQNPTVPAAIFARMLDRRCHESRTRLPNKCVVLLHDRVFHDPANQRQLIELIEELKGTYKFDTLDAY